MKWRGLKKRELRPLLFLLEESASYLDRAWDASQGQAVECLEAQRAIDDLADEIKGAIGEDR